MMDIVERLTLAIDNPQEAFPPNDWLPKVEQLFRDAKAEIERLRLAKLPNWAQAALTSSTAKITVTGKTISDQEMRDWLATIHEPIEKGDLTS
jgi:hypothetical protein